MLSDPFLQTGVLGGCVLALTTAVLALWKQSVSALKREQEISDELRTQIKETQTIQTERCLTTISAATEAIREVLALARGLGRR